MLDEPDVRFVAISDIQASRRQAVQAMARQKYGSDDCAEYIDMHELLARKDIDAVLIATGDHWHALASIIAAKAGKDVYSEKPCGITIADCQALADTMNRYGRVFQAGTQRRSSWAKSTPFTPRSTNYGSSMTGCRQNRNRQEKSSIGTDGSARPHGDPTTNVMSRADGEATSISIPAPPCWTGAPTQSISASGPTTRTKPCP